ncbi:MAG: SH3 domain-containing protein, partial [Erysipelotrichaceae bacterium]|nr:SH3 domain-containing protein [Erysipelotrichaceae bacterium]
AATNLNPGEITTDLSRIDRELYPGLVERVHALKQKYPKWEFEFYKTGLDWDRFVALEYSPTRNGSSGAGNPFNLVYDTYKGTWICEYRGTKKYDSGRWYAASYQAVEYAMDPRSYLNEYDIFSLKRVSDKKNALSKADSLVIIKGALQGRSYLNQAETIYNVATSENVDFVDVVARLIQEQGSGTVLTSGNRSADPNDTKLYYNPYNIGATGGTGAAVVANGTARAKKEGWDTFEKGLRGGIQLVKVNYAEQNTSYFEKFNATKSDYSGIYHQYMQNITAPFSEGSFKKDLYQEVDPYLTESSYTFVIPLYENMQKAATMQPNHFLTTPKGKTYTAPADPTLPAFANLNIGLRLRSGPGTNYTDLGTRAAGTLINVLEKKTNDWYYVQIVSTGEKGYMAKKEPGTSDYFSFQFKQNPTMFGKTMEYRHNANQIDPSLPSVAETTTDLNVRATPSTSGTRVDGLAFKSLISIREKVQDANGYEWYRIRYSLNKEGTEFTKTGYVARNPIGSIDYNFGYLSSVDTKVLEELQPLDPTQESELINQKNPKLPAYAILKANTVVKRGSGSLSSTTIRTLPKGTRISVRSKMSNKDGYEWYSIYYNLVDGKFQNSGYIARNKVGSSTQSFRYIINPDWSKCAYLLSKNEDSSTGSDTTTSEYPKTAKTTTTLNVRRGSGSLSSPII